MPGQVYVNQRRYAERMQETAQSMATALESIRGTLYCVLKKTGAIQLTKNEANAYREGCKVVPVIDEFMGGVTLVPVDENSDKGKLHVCATCANKQTHWPNLCRVLWRKTKPGFSCSAWKQQADPQAAVMESLDGG